MFLRRREVLLPFPKTSTAGGMTYGLSHIVLRFPEHVPTYVHVRMAHTHTQAPHARIHAHACTCTHTYILFGPHFLPIVI